MLWAVAIVLAISWALGVFVLKTAGWLIHLLLIAAVASVIIRIIRKK